MKSISKTFHLSFLLNKNSISTRKGKAAVTQVCAHFSLWVMFLNLFQYFPRRLDCKARSPQIFRFFKMIYQIQHNLPILKKKITKLFLVTKHTRYQMNCLPRKDTGSRKRLVGRKITGGDSLSESTFGPLLGFASSLGRGRQTDGVQSSRPKSFHYRTLDLACSKRPVNWMYYDLVRFRKLTKS